MGQIWAGLALGRVRFGLGWLGASLALGRIWTRSALAQLVFLLVGFLLGLIGFGLGWLFSELAFGWVSFRLGWLFSELAFGWVSFRLGWLSELTFYQVGFGLCWICFLPELPGYLLGWLWDGLVFS